MSNFQKFKQDILTNSFPITQDDINQMVDEINKNAHKYELFTDQLQSYLNDLPGLSITISKMFTIQYLEEYHKWLTENYNITPKN